MQIYKSKVLVKWYSRNKENALMFAAQKGNPEIVQKLIDAGAKIDLQDV